MGCKSARKFAHVNSLGEGKVGKTIEDCPRKFKVFCRAEILSQNGFLVHNTHGDLNFQRNEFY